MIKEKKYSVILLEINPGPGMNGIEEINKYVAGLY